MSFSSILHVESGLTNSLIRDYLNNSPSLHSFYSFHLNLDGFQKALDQRNFPNNQRGIIADVIASQYDQAFIHSAVLGNINALRNADAFAITTGHQLCFATGPMYLIFKIVSAIRLCKELKAKFPEKTFVPVYWMATEDHDSEEINHVFVGGKKITWPSSQKGAVGRLVPSNMDECLQELEEAIGNFPHANAVMNWLRKAYQSKTWSGSMRSLINELFESYGLIIIDADDVKLKSFAIPFFSRDLLQHDALEKVNAASLSLQNMGYSTQVNPRKVNLFYIENDVRKRIEHNENGSWSIVDTDLTFSKEEIIVLLNEHPEKFSPNVILRPLYQEIILPNLAYIGGPGEISYWLQLRSFFQSQSIPFPLLVLRDSAVIVSSRLKKKMDKVELEFSDLFTEKNIIIRKIVEKSGVQDLAEEKEKLVGLFNSVISKAKSADPTLEATANAELQKQLSSFDNLEKRIFRAAKTREEVKIQQIDKIWSEVFPNDQPMERSESMLLTFAEFGFESIDVLMKTFNPLEKKIWEVRF